MSFKRAYQETEEEKNKGWRFWLRALLGVIPQRNRSSLVKFSGVSRVYRDLVEEREEKEKDERNKTELEREYEKAE